MDVDVEKPIMCVVCCFPMHDSLVLCLWLVKSDGKHGKIILRHAEDTLLGKGQHQQLVSFEVSRA